MRFYCAIMFCKMYNILGEFCSLLIALVFFFFILSSFYLKERRNFMFFVCDIVLIMTCVSDILSCIFISNFQKYPLWACHLTSTLFFIALCTLPFVFCLYFYASISAVHKFSKIYHGLLITIYAVYLFIVFANLKTGWIYSFDPEKGYVRGSLKYCTFIFTGIQVIITEVAVFKYKRALSTRMFMIFVIYPILSSAVMSFQIFNERWLMTGCSGIVTMILMYLAIQSDRIEIDYKSGLKTEQYLERTMKKRTRPCAFTMISIENLRVLQEVFGSTEVDSFIYNLVRSFRMNVTGHLYRNGSTFMVLTPPAVSGNLEAQIKKSFSGFENLINSKGESYSFKYIAATINFPGDASVYSDAVELLKELIENARREKKEWRCCS